MRSKAAAKMMERYGSKDTASTGKGFLKPVLTAAGTALGAYVGGPAGAQLGGAIGSSVGSLAQTGDESEASGDEGKVDLEGIVAGLVGLDEQKRKKQLLGLAKEGKISMEDLAKFAREGKISAEQFSMLGGTTK